MKILLVDNDQRFLSTTKKLFAKQSHYVLTVSRGSEVLEKLRVQNIHVVILDVEMPGMDGIEILKEIKKHFPMVQVIMLTRYGTVNSAADSLKFGAIDYLIKPLDAEELFKITAEAFDKRQRLEQKIHTKQIDVLKHQFGCSD
jgi:DNA-binding NtrC family response regulator